MANVVDITAFVVSIGHARVRKVQKDVTWRQVGIAWCMSQRIPHVSSFDIVDDVLIL
jgi:hypothetical protein